MLTDQSQGNSSSEETTTTATETSSAPETTVETSSSETQGASPESQPTQQPYTPNYKFKAMDEEYEIDEEYRGYIKSQEDEKRIKRLFEQFKGVDKIKMREQEYQKKWSEAEPYVQKAQNYDMSFGAFNKLVQSGEYKKAFDLFQVPKEVIYKTALQYAEYDELPQQQKEVYNQLNHQESLNQQLYQQYQETQTQLQQIKSEARKTELQNLLSQPEVKTIAERYDQAYGPGTFKQQIINRGKQHFAATGQDLTATQVAQEFIQFAKPFLSVPQAPTTQTVPQAPKEVPVIPATGSSSGSSPGPAKIKNLAALKKLAEQYTD